MAEYPDGRAVDAANLLPLTKDNSTKRYVNLLIMEMISKGTSEISISEEEGLPSLSGADDFPMPEFGNVVNRLKIMSQLNAEMFREPKTGVTQISACIPPPEFLIKAVYTGLPLKRMGVIRSFFWQFGIVSTHSMRYPNPSPAEQAELESNSKRRNDERETLVGRYFREHPFHDFKIHTRFADRPTRSVTMRIEDLGPTHPPC